jgi:hypothetical protein
MIASVYFLRSSRTPNINQISFVKPLPLHSEGPIPTICTYFEKLEIHRGDEHADMLQIWNHSWSKQGWKTRILTEKDAEMHPDYKSIKRELQKLPSVNPQEYELACYIRWVAAVATGCTVRELIDLIFDPAFESGIG